MSHHVHKVKAFTVAIDDKVGALAKVTADLKSSNVNLRALCGWVEAGGKARAFFIPDDAEKVAACNCDTCSAAQPMSILWVEDADKTGAFDETLQALAGAGIDVLTASALAVGGQYGAVVLFKQPSDLDKALSLLGECCTA